MLEGLVGIFLKALFAAASGFALQLIAQQRNNANAAALGGNEVVAQTNQASADAERRAQDAMATQPGLVDMLADLAGGKF